MAVTTRSGYSAVTAFEAVNWHEKRSGVFQAQVSTPEHLAATATKYEAHVVIPIDGRLRAMYFICSAAVTGDDTNSTNINVDNGGVAGTGTTELANLDLATGNDLTAGAKTVITEALTTQVSAGTVLRVEFEKVGTGLLVPAGTFIVLYDAGY